MKKIIALILAVILMLGLTVPANAAGQAKAATMRLVQTEGTVTVKDASGVTQTVIKDMRLYSGYSVTTGDSSYAYISLDDTKAIKLDKNTSVTVKKSWGKLEVQLVSGELFFNVTAPLTSSESLQIRTSTMVTGIRGSSGWITPKLSYFLTGHGTVICFDASGALIRQFGVKGGEGVRGFPLMKPGTVKSTFDYEKITLDEYSFPWFVLVELLRNPGLRAEVEKEGVFDLDLMLDLIDQIKEEEDKEYERQLSQLIFPPTNSRPVRDNQIPLFEQGEIGEGIYEESDEQPLYYITFNPAGGSAVETIMLGEDESVTPPTPPEREGYTFAGWDPEIPAVMPAEDLNITALWTANKYTVTFYDEDGVTVLQTVEAEYDQMPEYTEEEPTKTATAQYSYEFAGWTPELAVVTGDAEYTATYSATLNKYTVTFVNDDDDILQETEVEYGQAPAYTDEAPTKAADDEYTYTFSGWTDGTDNYPVGTDLPAVTGDATYKATYTQTKNSYTITWQNDDGSTIDTTTVEYGVMPTHADAAKAATAEYTYTFSGWTPALTAVTGNATYKATYTATKNSYTITWLNDDGTLIDTTTVEYGTVPTHADTKKASTAEYSYTFSGWTDGTDNYPVGTNLPAVTGEATYTATYTQTKNSYTITWQNDDGSTIDTTTVEYGTVPTHADATKAATAEFTYTFSGWTPELAAVTGEATYKATFSATKNSYTITWQNDDGSTIDTTTVEYGTVPTHADATKAATAEYTYTFSGWTPELAAVTGEATYKATYTETANPYTITFNTDGGSAIAPITLGYGSAITAPANPTKEGYTFSGWSPAIPATMPAQNLTITAQWTINTYSVSFEMNGHGTAPTQQTVEYNDFAEQPDDPSATGFTFIGWFADEALTKPFDFAGVQITDDTVIYAKWSTNTYLVTFYDEDGSFVLQNGEVGYGTVPEYTSGGPTKDPDGEYTYAFAGWNDGTNTYTGTLPTVKGITTYTAVYEKVKYMVTVTVPSGASITVDEGDGSKTFDTAGTNEYGYVDPNTLLKVSFSFTMTDTSEAIAGPATTLTASKGTIMDGNLTVEDYTNITVSNLYTVLTNPLLSIPDEDGYYAVVDTVSCTGNITLNGELYVTGTGLLSADSGTVITNNGTITNEGKIILPQDGQLYNGEDGLITNEGTIEVQYHGLLNNYGTIDNNDTIDIQENGTLSNYGTLNNNGTLNNDGTLNNYSGDTIHNYGVLKNAGTLNNGAADNTYSGRIVNHESGYLLNEGEYHSWYGSQMDNRGTFFKMHPANAATNYIDDGELKNTGLAADYGGFFDASDLRGTYWYMNAVDTGYSLTLAGAGATPDYSATAPTPWSTLADDIVSVTVEDSITAIGSGCFLSCSAMTDVSLGSGLTSIGASAFQNCPGLVSITIPETVASIGASCFSGCSALKSVTFSGSSSLKALPKETFSACSSLESITIPNSVESIGNACFHMCSKLASINFGSGVKTIGDGSSVFYGCSSLQSLTIPNNVTSITSQAFEACGNLTTVVIGSGLTSIPDGAFTGCSNISSLTIGSNVKTIGASAFPQNKITELVIPNSVTTIGNRAFYNCGELKTLTLGENVETIGEEAFYQCTKLQSLSIPESVTSIGTRAFAGCSALASIDSFGGLTSISESAFYGCSSLGKKTSDVPEENYFAFPDSITSFGNNAFAACGFYILDFSGVDASTLSFGDGAFANCNDLAAVLFAGDPPKAFGTGVFDGCVTGMYINVSSSGDHNLKWEAMDEYDDVRGTWYGYNYHAHLNAPFIKGYNI